MGIYRNDVKDTVKLVEQTSHFTDVREFEAVVTTVHTFTIQVARTGCGRCGKRAPPPDDNAVLFVQRNRDGNRLVFPDAEDADEERDRYPVKGWRRWNGKLLCTSCDNAMEVVLKG